MKIIKRLKKSRLGEWLIKHRRSKLNMLEYDIKITNLQNRVDALQYYIEKNIDITSFPPDNGKLRKIQLANVKLLQIFLEVCDSLDLRVWINWGTLLGAVRHKGFIPWDDDVDVSMPREDYVKAQKLLPEVLKKYGIVCRMKDTIPWLSVTYKYSITQTWIDIFPFDGVKYDVSNGYDELRKKSIEYLKFFKKNRFKLSEEEMIKKREQMKGSPTNENPVWCYDFHVYENDVIFPLSTLKFEGVDCPVPNKYEVILKTNYGNYMSYPKSIIGHNDIIINDIEFDQAKKELDNIYETLMCKKNQIH